jgi:hypothetical protein
MEFEPQLANEAAVSCLRDDINDFYVTTASFFRGFTGARWWFPSLHIGAAL